MTLEEYARAQKKATEATEKPGNAIQIGTEAPKKDPATDLPEEYRRVYRAVYEYQKRHNPPAMDDEWLAAAKDINATASALGNTKFAIKMLEVVYAEWERLANLRKGIKEAPKKPDFMGYLNRTAKALEEEAAKAPDDKTRFAAAEKQKLLADIKREFIEAR